MSIYYVYAYIRSKDSATAKAGTPYYIGKGKYNRAWSKTHRVNLPKNIHNIVILESGLSEIGALALERRYIRWYGRVDNKTGILHNLTDGGDGVSGLIFTEDHKNKLRAYNLGKTISRENVEKMRQANIGKPRSDKTKEKISKGNKGKIRSDECKKANSEKQKGKKQPINHTLNKCKWYLLISPTGEEYTVHGLKYFCDEHKLNRSLLAEVAQGKKDNYKGWKCSYLSL